MHRKASTTPLLEAPGPTNPDPDVCSPAHDALQSTLDNGVTVKKKNSWLNIGASFRKGASAVKGAFDFVRGDSTAAEEPQPAQSTPVPTSKEAIGEQVQPLTPKRSVQRYNTFSPKAATSSLRNHFPRPTSQGGNRNEFVDGGGASPIGPDQIVAHGQDDIRKTPHRRRISLSGTLGSIRSRRSNRATSLRKMEACDGDTAPILPAPSSPITIPSAAQYLSLNLSPAGMMTPPFGNEQRRDSKTDNADFTKEITRGLPDDRGICVPEELEASTRLRELHQATMSELTLALPPSAMSRDWHGLALEGPATPMPGTNVPLELGVDIGETSPVFERSVETPGNVGGHDDHALRHMCSLDALAQSSHDGAQLDGANDSTDALALTAQLSHATHEHQKTWNQGTMGFFDTASTNVAQVFGQPPDHNQVVKLEASPVESLSDGSTPLADSGLIPAPLDIPQRPRPRRDCLSAATTISIIPPDMDMPCVLIPPVNDRDIHHGDVERWAKDQLHKDATNEELRDLDWPCSLGSAHSGIHTALSALSGPPSPTRSLDLPFRTKYQVSYADSPNFRTSFSHETDIGPKIVESSVLGEFQRDGLISTDVPGSRSYAVAELGPSLTAQNQVILDGDQTLEQLHSASVPDDTSSVTTDYDEFKGQLFFPENPITIDFPNYDYNSGPNNQYNDIDCPSPVAPLHNDAFSGSANSVPLVPVLARAVNNSQDSSPASQRSNIGRTDVGRLMYRFTVNNWFGGPFEEVGPGATSPSQHLDDSLDGRSDSTETAVTIGDPFTDELGTLPSMGDKVDFELKRSDRNSRYNTLQTACVPGRASSRPQSAEYTFGEDDLKASGVTLDRGKHSKEIESSRADSFGYYDDHSTETDPPITFRFVCSAPSNGDAILAGAAELGAVDSSSPAKGQKFWEDRVAYRGQTKDAHFGSFDRKMEAPGDSVETSSPSCLTDWERQNFQNSVPPHAPQSTVPQRELRSPASNPASKQSGGSEQRSSSPGLHNTHFDSSPISPRKAQSHNKFEILFDHADMASSPTPEPEQSGTAKALSPLSAAEANSRNRVVSNDTLDGTLALFSEREEAARVCARDPCYEADSSEDAISESKVRETLARGNEPVKIEYGV
ncbi:hypothetical protein LTR62_004119 [Meristemomyces frigidus]|uniref:Uncharacterized protein n=1 Tax=Meristemomyces frigidus TaxID=1508187 RepID=A0AAN7YN78_9PEZI|nr:hypothetical protein LTR62_004119 [Meristemomyces frigidus]